MSNAFKKFKEIVNSAPDELKFILFANKAAPQRIDKHPEGNVLKHIMIVTMRAIDRFPNDMDLIMAAFFHDLGKYSTVDINPSTGQPNALGHEDVSAEYVDKFSDWIFDMGARPDIVYDIVKYHMAYKNLDSMKTKKQTEFYGMKNFDKIKKFGTLDKGGWFKPDIKEYVKQKMNVIMEEKMINNETLNKILHHYIETALWTEEERIKDDYGVNNDLVYGDSGEKDFDDEIEKIVRLQSNLNKKGFDRFSGEDIESDSLIKAYMDIKKFIKIVGEDIIKKAIEEVGPEQIGHDLWLTRNRHGAGFFDGQYDEEIEEKLINGAHALGEVDLYLTDNATLSFSNEHIWESKKNIGVIKEKLKEKINLIMEQKNERYMFFSNLEQIKRQADLLLRFDRDELEKILDNGHDWAQDHVAESKSFLDQVFDFIMNETKVQKESLLKVYSINEAKKNKPTNPELWKKALSWARSRYKVCPSAYCNGAAAKRYKSMGGKWKKG